MNALVQFLTGAMVGPLIAFFALALAFFAWVFWPGSE